MCLQNCMFVEFLNKSVFYQFYLLVSGIFSFILNITIHMLRKLLRNEIEKDKKSQNT